MHILSGYAANQPNIKNSKDKQSQNIISKLNLPRVRSCNYFQLESRIYRRRLLSKPLLYIFIIVQRDDKESKAKLTCKLLSSIAIIPLTWNHTSH